MCLVALYFQVFEDAPVVVGANREEAYARGGEPPRVLEGTPRAVGGLDPLGGGTWLGVNECGVLVAVTNRPRRAPPLRPRSRGLLARDLLGCSTAGEAADRAVRELRQQTYAGCNFLCADGRQALVLHANHEPHVRELSPGLHLLTANDVDDPGDARQELARQWLYGRAPTRSAECVAALGELCGLTGDAPLCLRGEDRGTVSASIIAVRQPLDRSTYLHAQGPPDRTPFLDCSHLFCHFLPPGGVRG